MISIIIKNKLFGIILLISIAVFFACKKETPVIITPTDPCEPAYSINSTPYKNLYKGELNISCPVMYKISYLDHYSYLSPSVNPNNPYEFCYLRKDHRSPNSDSQELYKFNFCTGKATLLANNVIYHTDWNSKDWILFNSLDSWVYKIKSNGDSLTKLIPENFDVGDGIWSPDGTKILTDNNVLYNENGKVIKKINTPMGARIWLNDNEILYLVLGTTVPNTNFELARMNIYSEKSTIVYSESQGERGAYLYNYDRKSKLAHAVIDKNGKDKFLQINCETWETKDLATNERSYIPLNIQVIDKNFMLARLILRDTMTGSTCRINSRSHIALMNLDGTNERQVLIPE